MDDTCKICQCVLEVKLRCKICKVAMYCVRWPICSTYTL